MTGSVISMFGICAGIFGYYGAKRFKRSYTFIYFIYLCLVSLIRFSYPYLVKYMLGEKEAKKYDLTSLYVYSIFLGMAELFIAHFVFRFWRLLPKNRLDRETLIIEIKLCLIIYFS